MKNVIEILKNYYKPIENAKGSREFFFSLADYVKYIKTIPELKKIIQGITEEKEGLLKKWDEYETKALKELEGAKQKLLKIVQQKQISSPELDEAIKELNWYETGKISSSGIKSDNIENHLWEIAKAVFQTKHKEFLKEFIDEKSNTPNIYIDNKNFVFSEIIEKRRVIDKGIVELRNTELWGCWDYLNLVFVILLEKREFYEVVSEGDLGIANVYVKTKEIIFGKNYLFDREKTLDIESPEILEYKNYASRIHNHLLEKLGLPQKRKDEEIIKLSPEIYGIGINLKVLFKKILKKINKQIKK